MEPVKGCRNVGKRQMKLNDAMPEVTVDPEKFVRFPPTPLPLPLPQSLPWFGDGYWIGRGANFLTGTGGRKDCGGGWKSSYERGVGKTTAYARVFLVLSGDDGGRWGKMGEEGGCSVSFVLLEL